jgi:hypothetical protein
VLALHDPDHQPLLAFACHGIYRLLPLFGLRGAAVIAPHLKTKRMSMDDLIDSLNIMAQDNDAGPDKFRALKMLASMNSTAITVPAPLTGDEVIDRLARLIRAAGRVAAQLAFVRAFPADSKRSEGTRSAITDAPKVSADHLTPEDIARVKKIRGLKRFYKEFPEMKRPGFPPGYPVGRGREIQEDWIRRQATKILVDRAQAAANQAAAGEATGSVDAEVRGDPDLGGTTPDPGRTQEV